MPWRGLGAIVLFGGSAGVVLWQSTRVAALHDLSYVLNTAYRIAEGDVPYRDFSQPHAPLTFLIQAAILRLFDSSCAHHTWYAALLSGAATLLTAAVLRLLLRPRFPRADLYAFVGCLPLIPLGIHSLFPHPWYDADASFLALLALFAFLRANQEQARGGWAALAGVLSVLPFFAKQNVGLPLLAASQVLALPWLFQPGRRRRYALFLAGAGAALLLALGLVHATCGLDNYARWTFSFAAQRRLTLALPLMAYRRSGISAWGPVAGIGLLLLAALPRPEPPGVAPSGRRAWIGAALLLSALIVPLPFRHGSGLFLRLWLLTLPLAAALAALLWLRERSRFEPLFTLTLIAFCYGAFLSQGVSGSNFAIWPFFCLLTGGILIGLRSLAPALAPRLGEAYLAACVGAAVLTGVPQLVENRRLDYLRREGPVRASQHPRLRGLHAAGEYAPRLDELLAFFEQHVPPQEAFTAIPGEDPLYFALRRRPRLPLVQFDRTVNPWSAEEFLERARAAGIDWIVVKRERQLLHQPQGQFVLTVRLALREYEPVFDNDAYQVLRRRR